MIFFYGYFWRHNQWRIIRGKLFYFIYAFFFSYVRFITRIRSWDWRSTIVIDNEMSLKLKSQELDALEHSLNLRQDVLLETEIAVSLASESSDANQNALTFRLHERERTGPNLTRYILFWVDPFNSRIECSFWAGVHTEVFFKVLKSCFCWEFSCEQLRICRVHMYFV